MRLTERQQLLLLSIIRDYIQTGTPVGSRTLSKLSNLGISPATIRNEMADLEEMGLLEQPHISAGRIPSDLGYRIFVDYLMEEQQLASREEQGFASRLGRVTHNLEYLLDEASRLLSSATQTAGVVIGPPQRASTIRHLQLVELSEGKVLLVVVLSNGTVHNGVIHLPEFTDESDLTFLTNFLNENLRGLTLSQVNLASIKRINPRIQPYQRVIQESVEKIEKNLRQSHMEKVMASGLNNLLRTPEFQDSDRFSALLTLLEEADDIRRLLEKYQQEPSVTLRIGDENLIPALKGCTIVAAPYFIHETPVGVLGVIGPTRMSYERNVAYVRSMARTLSKLLSELY